MNARVSQILKNPKSGEKVFSCNQVLTITDEDVEAIIKFLTDNDDINRAEFQFSKLLNKEIARIIAGSWLTSLDFTYSDIRDGENIEDLARAIQINIFLFELRLPALPYECMSVIAEALAKHPRLKSLSLELYGEGDDRMRCAEAIAKIITSNSHLETLSIKGNAIDDGAAKIIANALANNKALKELKFPDLKKLKLPDLNEILFLTPQAPVCTFTHALVVASNKRGLPIKLVMSPTLEVDKENSFKHLLLRSENITQFQTSMINGIERGTFKEIKIHIGKNNNRHTPSQPNHMIFNKRLKTPVEKQSSQRPSSPIPRRLR